MKLKKINLAFAIAVLIVAAITGGVMKSFTSPVVNPVSGNVATVDNSGLAEQSGLFASLKDKQVTEIPWQSFKGRIPGKVTLKKWKEGNRLYYRMSGPVNEDTVKAGGKYFKDRRAQWGKNTEMEVFFDRGDGRYDQWLINPKNAQVLHYDGKNKFRDSSKLPSSRYSYQMTDDELSVTFWCDEDDSPGNVVFNYNPNGNARDLRWTTTGKDNGGKGANHHAMERWTNP